MDSEIKTQEMEQHGATLVSTAQSFKLAQHEDYEGAGVFLNQVTQTIKNIEGQFEEPVQKAFQAHRAMTALRDKVLRDFKEAKRIISDKIGFYAQEQERKRREAAAAAAAEAQKRAEEERLRLAQAAEDRGDKKAADALLDAPLTPKLDPSMIPQEAPKVKGVTTRRAWDFTFDVNKLPREYLIADESKIRRVVNALGEQTAIPGVTVFEKTIVGSRGTR